MKERRKETFSDFEEYSKIIQINIFSVLPLSVDSCVSFFLFFSLSFWLCVQRGDKISGKIFKCGCLFGLISIKR